VNFCGLTYWMVTLLGCALTAGAASNANKIAAVRKRIGGLFIFLFIGNGQRI
jgi:hypothetical protein